MHFKEIINWNYGYQNIVAFKCFFPVWTNAQGYLSGSMTIESNLDRFINIFVYFILHIMYICVIKYLFDIIKYLFDMPLKKRLDSILWPSFSLSLSLSSSLSLALSLSLYMSWITWSNQVKTIVMSTRFNKLRNFEYFLKF